VNSQLIRMRYIFIILLFSIQISNAQQVSLRISNPSPHVGQSVTVTWCDNEQKCYGKEPTLSYSTIVKDTGQLRIGPFFWNDQGKAIVTEEITLNALPMLDTIHPAIHARIVYVNNKYYLIIEDVFPENSTSVDFNYLSGYTVSEEVKNNGLVLSEVYKSFRETGSENKMSVFEFVYQINMEPTFKGNFLFEKRHFPALSTKNTFPILLFNTSRKTSR